MHMSPDDPALEELINMQGNVPIVGQVSFLPPVKVTDPQTGQDYAVPQVFVCNIHPGMISAIAAHTAVAVTEQVLQALVERGIIPAPPESEAENQQASNVVDEPTEPA